MAETISGKESIRMRADALELTLAAAAKKVQSNNDAQKCVPKNSPLNLPNNW